MPLFSLDELAEATAIVRAFVPVTPTYAWPLLARRTGVEVFVKHENHTPTGAFKVRGGLVYFETLRQAEQLPKGVVTATRGNHGQSIAVAALRNGVQCLVIVPQGNSEEKNAAMRGFGAEVLGAGADFDESRSIAVSVAEERGYQTVPAFHPTIVKGVATCAYELLKAVPELAVVYVPIGMGSGICGMITVRDLLGLNTEIVGVVADKAPAFALSFNAGHPVITDSARTFADGIACRNPQPEPLAIIRKGVSRILRVSEDEIADAIRIYYLDTHNIAEGAAAASLAGLIRERARYTGQRVATVFSGANIDVAMLTEVLSGRTPQI